MSDYYWQQNMPTSLHLDYITQVKYTAHPLVDGIFEIKQTNKHVKETTHRVNLPQRYHDFVMKVLWRLNLLVELYQTFCKRKAKKFTNFLPYLARILVHMDNVVEALIRPAVNLSMNEVKQYHSPNFHEYLITEYLIGRHDPAIVQQFRETYDMNIERIKLYHLGRVVSLLLLTCLLKWYFLRLE